MLSLSLFLYDIIVIIHTPITTTNSNILNNIIRISITILLILNKKKPYVFSRIIYYPWKYVTTSEILWFNWCDSYGVPSLLSSSICSLSMLFFEKLISCGPIEFTCTTPFERIIIRARHDVMLLFAWTIELGWFVVWLPIASIFSSNDGGCSTATTSLKFSEFWNESVAILTVAKY